MNLVYTIDIKSLTGALKQNTDEIKKELMAGVELLASATHAKTLELATQNLGSLQKQYKKGVSFAQVEDGMWVVSLDESIMWIEEGVANPWSMYDKIATSKKAKTTKAGHKYLTIPFEHSKAPSEQTIKAENLTDQIRAFLKQKKIPYKKIEYNNDGSPKIGLIHRFDIQSAQPTKKAKDPALKGVAIYQRMEGGKVKRDVMTFRVVSEKNKGDGRWEYPAREGVKILDKVYDWCVNEWETKILPSIMSQYGSK